MDIDDVVSALRSERITVLHAIRPTMTPGGLRLVVVFLESTLGQADEAQECLRGMPEIGDVTFARHTKAIMYVFLSG